MSENNQFNEAPSPAKRYSAAMDSVNLINARILAPQENQTQEQRTYDIERNVERLKNAVDWDIWTNEDLSALHAEIVAGDNWLS